MSIKTLDIVIDAIMIILSLLMAFFFFKINTMLFLIWIADAIIWVIKYTLDIVYLTREKRNIE
jgi:hypothetical protein